MWPFWAIQTTSMVFSDLPMTRSPDRPIARFSVPPCLRGGGTGPGLPSLDGCGKTSYFIGKVELFSGIFVFQSGKAYKLEEHLASGTHGNSEPPPQRWPFRQGREGWAAERIPQGADAHCAG